MPIAMPSSTSVGEDGKAMGGFDLRGFDLGDANGAAVRPDDLPDVEPLDDPTSSSDESDGPAGPPEGHPEDPPEGVLRSAASPSKAKSVHFPDPSAITAVRTRPRTDPGQVAALYYSGADVRRFKREARRAAESSRRERGRRREEGREEEKQREDVQPCRWEEGSSSNCYDLRTPRERHEPRNEEKEGPEELEELRRLLESCCEDVDGKDKNEWVMRRHHDYSYRERDVERRRGRLSGERPGSPPRDEDEAGSTNEWHDFYDADVPFATEGGGSPSSRCRRRDRLPARDVLVGPAGPQWLTPNNWSGEIS